MKSLWDIDSQSIGPGEELMTSIALGWSRGRDELEIIELRGVVIGLQTIMGTSAA